MSAIMEANRLDIAYDGDQWSRSLDARFSDLFDTPVRAMWMPSGTSSNALALTTLCPPHGGIVCHRNAHIQNDEAGAPEFYTHGAKLMLVEGEGAKLDAETVRAALNLVKNAVHQVQPHAISITNATEYGLAYSPDEVAAFGDIARQYSLGLHMDGARFANAVAHLGCAPSDISWRAGVDVLSFGFIKNGGMNAEALIFFRPQLADLALRLRKRAGLLLSKGRFLAAQLHAMLDNNLWLSNARAANDSAQLLGRAAGERLIHPVEANEIFLRMSQTEATSLRALDFDFYDWSPGEARLVTSWDQQVSDIARLAAAIEALQRSGPDNMQDEPLGAPKNYDAASSSDKA